MLVADVDAEPWNPILLGILGRMRMLRREYEEACAAWTKAIELWTGHDDGAIASLKENIAEVRLVTGRGDEALREYGDAASGYRRARTEGISGIALDNYKWREAYCLAKAGQPSAAQELLLEIRQGPNAALFEEQIRSLECAMLP